MEQRREFERHVRDCSRRNEDRMHELIAHREGNYFSSPADRERYAHFRRGGN